MFIFATLSPGFQIFIGVFSATIFIVSIIPPTLSIDVKILENKIAIQLWGEWIRDAKSFCNGESNQLDLASLTVRQKEILKAYKKVMETTPLIPDNKFNKYKRLHLQKVEISKELSKNPFKTIKQIKEVAQIRVDSGALQIADPNFGDIVEGLMSDHDTYGDDFKDAIMSGQITDVQYIEGVKTDYSGMVNIGGAFSMDISSGYGAGTYPVYIGNDANEKLAVVYVDFLLFERNDVIEQVIHSTGK